MAKPREKTREELTAEIEDGKKEIPWERRVLAGCLKNFLRSRIDRRRQAPI